MLLNCDVGEDSWESLGQSEIQPVNPKGNQSWIFVARTDAEAETPILWPPDVKNWFLGKDPDTEMNWRQEEKRMTEDEKVGWHHWLNGYSLSKLQELVMDREAWCAAVHDVPKSRTRLSDWTELNIIWGSVTQGSLLYAVTHSCQTFSLTSPPKLHPLSRSVMTSMMPNPVISLCPQLTCTISSV